MLTLNIQNLKTSKNLQELTSTGRTIDRTKRHHFPQDNFFLAMSKWKQSLLHFITCSVVHTNIPIKKWSHRESISPTFYLLICADILAQIKSLIFMQAQKSLAKTFIRKSRAKNVGEIDPVSHTNMENTLTLYHL